MRTGTRIRDAARWMAAILGLALSALIGTAPFTNIRSDELTRASATFAMAGLLFIAITMFLVLRVLIPRATTFEDIQGADQRVPKEPGLWWKLTNQRWIVLQSWKRRSRASRICTFRQV